MILLVEDEESVRDFISGCMRAAGFVVMPLVSIEELEAQAQEQRPDLAQARARLKQALINTEIARAAYIPDMGVQFGYLHNGNSGLLPGTYLTVALVATWDIFDWGGRDADIRAKAQQAEEASLQTWDARQRAALEENKP